MELQFTIEVDDYRQHEELFFSESDEESGDSGMEGASSPIEISQSLDIYSSSPRGILLKRNQKGEFEDYVRQSPDRHISWSLPAPQAESKFVLNHYLSLSELQARGMMSAFASMGNKKGNKKTKKNNRKKR
eukprot:TRINITY_DN1038_c0_g1_i3.p1 TRINITY_DN1038_c0_g1~~TRINITY_DN1038_c0_g1_i3.p1  ORF type:complete len:131 (+),score=24.50 TRINITY_DN1038_c0_g1_i3:172-564(+)